MSISKSGEYRRHAILLFADLCDFTSLNEAADPEDVALILHALRNKVERLIHEHGGSVNEWRGDGVLCTFGLPRSSELDAQRAIEAALAMHAVVSSLELELPVPSGFELHLHSGLHSGLVFATERDAAQGYDLVGDAVNTAARLCEHARRDELWVSADAIEGVKELFETEPVEHLQLKGKRSVVPAFRVLQRSEVANRFAASQRRGLTPLVGREWALSQLQAGLRAALSGTLTVLSVVGNPGAGKTRLLEEFRGRTPKTIHVVTGRCGQAGNAKPLEPFLDILMQCLKVPPRAPKSEIVAALAGLVIRLDRGLDKHETAFLHLLGLEHFSTVAKNSELVQHSLIDALSDLFAALCQAQPLVIALDDWQWADDASRQVLGELLRRLEHSAALLLVASREILDPILVGLPSLELRPFDREESAEVIAALLPFALDLGLKRAIHERSGGNPLFLEELCRALPSAAPAGMEDLIAGKVPITLRGIIQVRVERLREVSLHVLWAAAVVGSEIPVWLLERVSGVSDLRDQIDELLREDLIYEVELDRSFRFKHATTRDVVYESVRLPERRRLHREATVALRERARETELPEPYEELAYHSAGAGDHEQAAHFGELAGDKAAASSSLDRARQQYRVAIEALERLGLAAEREQRWFTLVSKWAAATLYSPAPEHLGLVERALAYAQSTGNARAATRAEYWLTWFQYAIGNQEPAIVHCRNALRQAIQNRDGTLVAQLQLNLGQCLAAAGKYDEALDYFGGGVAAKHHHSAERVGPPAAERRTPLGFAYALACRGLVHGDQGDFVEAYRAFDDALALLRGTGHAVEGSCLGLLGMVQLLQGRWQAALSTALRTQATAERVNGPYVFATSKTISGYARWILERSDRALAELVHAVKWMETRGVGLFISFNYGYLAEALLDAGELESAADYAERALARAPADPLGEASAYRTLARLAYGSAPDDAAALLNKAMAAALSRKSAREVALTELARLRIAPNTAARDPRPALRAMGMEHYESEATFVLGSPAMPALGAEGPVRK